MTRHVPPCCLAPLALLVACAGARLTPAQEALRSSHDCAALLHEADRARAAGEPKVARLLAEACPSDAFDRLVNASTSEEALLWCGRAAAANPRGKPACERSRVEEEKKRLHPRLTLGPSDEGAVPDPMLLDALERVGASLGLAFSPDPDVIVGKLLVEVEHQSTPSLRPLVDPKGKRRQVPATNHRIVAHVTGDLDLKLGTSTLRKSYEALRYTTWEAQPRWQIEASPPPSVPSDAEVQGLAVAAWLTNAAAKLAFAPPDTVDVTDAKGCVAYGLALTGLGGDPLAAAHRHGAAEKLDACERLLGEPPGAGIPVP